MPPHYTHLRNAATSFSESEKREKRGEKQTERDKRRKANTERTGDEKWRDTEQKTKIAMEAEKQ